jgi:hypothetical protein
MKKRLLWQVIIGIFFTFLIASCQSTIFPIKELDPEVKDSIRVIEFQNKTASELKLNTIAFMSTYFNKATDPSVIEGNIITGNYTIKLPNYRGFAQVAYLTYIIKISDTSIKIRFIVKNIQNTANYAYVTSDRWGNFENTFNQEYDSFTNGLKDFIEKNDF